MSVDDLTWLVYKEIIGIAWKVIGLASEFLEKAPVKITAESLELQKLPWRTRFALSFVEEHRGRMWEETDSGLDMDLDLSPLEPEAVVDEIEEEQFDDIGDDLVGMEFGRIPADLI